MNFYEVYEKQIRPSLVKVEKEPDAMFEVEEPKDEIEEHKADQVELFTKESYLKKIRRKLSNGSRRNCYFNNKRWISNCMLRSSFCTEQQDAKNIK